MRENFHLENTISLEEENNIIALELTTLRSEIVDKSYKSVDKLDSGRVRITFVNAGDEREFILEKKGDNKTSVWVKKKGNDGKRYTQGNTSLLSQTGEPEQLIFSDAATFNRKFGAILDKYVGTKRVRILDQSVDAYKLLFIAEKSVEKKNGGLKKKPIDLGYTKKYKEGSLYFENKTMPFKRTFEGKVMRCMRWKPITDQAEKRYGIPSGLLIAMMAQEGGGDPIKPNEGGDGGLGLIHIQGINAQHYGLDTLPLSHTRMVDKKHGAKIQKAISDRNKNLQLLINDDDRFHPVLAIDVAARFLLDKYNETSGEDRWLKALMRYSGRRNYSQYVYPVLQYRTVVNKVTGASMENFCDREANNVINAQSPVKHGKDRYNTDEMYMNTQCAIENLQVTDGKNEKNIGFSGYLSYYSKQCENFELDKYRQLGQYQH